MKATIKRAVITGGLETIAQARLGRLAPSAAGRGIVFTLHHVRPHGPHAAGPGALLSITPDFLDAAIGTAVARGYRPVALAEMTALIAGPDDGRRYAAFTLDDGLRDNIEHAAPVFRRRGVPYTLFVARGLVERTHTMWWETVEALVLDAHGPLEFDFGDGAERLPLDTARRRQRAFDRFAAFVERGEEEAAVAAIDAFAAGHGVDARAIVEREVADGDALASLRDDPLARLGAHTVSHRNLARLAPDELAGEIEASVDAVRGWSAREVVSIAYPYGWSRACGAREALAARAAGLRIGVTTRPGVLRGAGEDDPMLLPRVSLNGLYQKPRYVEALMTGLPFLV